MILHSYIYYSLSLFFTHFSILITSIRADKNKIIIGLLLSIENKGGYPFLFLFRLFTLENLNL